MNTMQSWPSLRLLILKITSLVVLLTGILGFWLMPTSDTPFREQSPAYLDWPPATIATFQQQSRILQTVTYGLGAADVPQFFPTLVYRYESPTRSIPAITAKVTFLDQNPGSGIIVNGLQVWPRLQGIILPENLDRLPQPLLQPTGSGDLAQLLYNDRLHQASCLLPTGELAFSYQAQNNLRNYHATQPLTVLRWILGFGDLRDWRCIWLSLSIPVNATIDQATAQEVLQQFWSSWIPLWRSSRSFAKIRNGGIALP